jgi:transcriptional regulator with XRE-family HTH domain
MPRGIPSEIQVGPRTYSCRQIADGAGLSISLISLIFCGKRPVSPYAQTRLATFFRMSVEELLTPGTIKVHPPRLRRPLGRAVYRITPNTVFPYGRPPVRDRDAALRLLEGLESETCPPCPRGQLEDSDKLPQESEPFPPRTFGDSDE